MIKYKVSMDDPISERTNISPIFPLLRGRDDIDRISHIKKKFKFLY